jgi:hypothetical protein
MYVEQWFTSTFTSPFFSAGLRFRKCVICARLGKYSVLRRKTVRLRFCDSWHTRGFYERTAALYHHSQGTPLKRLFWVAVPGGRGGSTGRARIEVCDLHVYQRMETLKMRRVFGGELHRTLDMLAVHRGDHIPDPKTAQAAALPEITSTISAPPVSGVTACP